MSSRDRYIAENIERDQFYMQRLDKLNDPLERDILIKLSNTCKVQLEEYLESQFYKGRLDENMRFLTLLLREDGTLVNTFSDLLDSLRTIKKSKSFNPAAIKRHLFKAFPNLKEMLKWRQDTRICSFSKFTGQ